MELILQLPLALALYGIALALCLADRVLKTPRLSLISAALAVVATAYAILMGAGLWDCATVLLVFLLLNMGVEE